MILYNAIKLWTSHDGISISIDLFSLCSFLFIFLYL